MRKLFTSLAVFAVVLAVAAPVEAQFARAGLSGRVDDPDGSALPGVTVTVRNEATGFTRTAVTSINGGYVFNGLTPGTYTVTFELEGFRTVERQGIELRVGTTSTLDVSLELGSVEETITVTAQTPLVETTSKEVGGTVTSQEFNDLPSQNRSFVMFARLLPGVNASPSTESTASDSIFVNGQDDNNNSFNVDGAANDDDAIGARAGAQTRTALDAIQEFQILTTQFDAEFGRTQGAVLNAVTKSGANQFSGSGFFYFQDSELNDANFFVDRNNLPKPDTQFKSVGGTLGGPIVQDRAHFFVSFERNTPEEGQSRAFATRPDLNFSTTEDNLLRNWLVKGDWQASPNHQVSVRYLREYSPQFNQIIGSATTLSARREEDDTDQNLIGSVDSVITDTAFNNLRISWTQEDVAFANPCYNGGNQDFATQRGCDVLEDHPSFIQGTNNVAQDRLNNSYQFDDTFSIYVPDLQGDHDMRVGGNYAHKEIENNFNDTANGVFTFNSDQDFDASDPSTYPVAFSARLFGSAAGVTENDALGLFFQDDWQPIENLTLNLGLRYDWEDIVEDTDNIAPRLGFSWDPMGEGRTVVRGGWGRFYERFQMGVFSGFILDSVDVTQGFFGSLPEAGESQQLFVDLAASQGITTLNGLRDAAVALLESGGAASILNPNPTVDNASRRSAYADTFTLGLEHEVWEGISAGVDYVHTENQDILFSTDLNPFSSSLGRPDISILNGQVDPRFQSITTYLNAGESTYDSLQFQVRKRMSQTPVGNLSGRVSYTWANQEGTADAQQVDSSRFQERTLTGYDFDAGEIIGEAPDLGLDHPANLDHASPWHRTHMFVGSWTWQVPGTSWNDNGGLLVTGIYEWRSGDRWEVLLFDRFDNGNRMIAPAGTYAANATSDIAFDPIEFDGKENGAEEDSISRLDLSFRYRVPIQNGRYSVTILADVFNINDTVNFGNHGSSFAASNGFLIPTSALQPREFQIGARVDF